MKPALRVTVLALGLGLLAIASPGLSTEHPSLFNGDFSRGSGSLPEGWRTESWVNEPTTSYTWKRAGDGQAGQVEITNLEPNDARWTQSLVLDPGMYLVTAEVRTEGVSSNIGAFISLGDEGIASRDISGDGDWQRVGFLVDVKHHPAKVEVKLRLGGFKNFSTGRAYFRQAGVFMISDVPPGAAPFDLNEIRERWKGNPASVIWLFALLASTTIAGWRLFAGQPMISSSREPRSRTPRARRAPKP